VLTIQHLPEINSTYSVSKKSATLTWLQYCQFLIDLLNSFTAAKSTKFPTKPTLGYLLMVMQRISNVYTSRLHLRLHYRARETIGLLQCETPGFIILFCPTYGRLTARPKSSRLHGVGSDGAACLPEQSERC